MKVGVFGIIRKDSLVKKKSLFIQNFLRENTESSLQKSFPLPIILLEKRINFYNPNCQARRLLHCETWRSYSIIVARFHRGLYLSQQFIKRSKTNPRQTLQFIRTGILYRVSLIFPLLFTLCIYDYHDHDIYYLTWPKNNN